MGHVSGLFVAEASMKQMVSKKTVDLLAGKGIAGDRYAEGRGTYQPFKEPGRQITLISADSVEEKTATKANAPSVGDLRRNVVIRGASAAELASYVGMQVRLGAECRVFVHRLCVPCKYNMRLNKCPLEMEEHLWDVTGVNCEVISGGKLKIGDSVEVVPDSNDAGRIEHGKPPEFFMKPSQRPKNKTQGRASTELPESVRRAYAAVMNNAVPPDDDKPHGQADSPKPRGFYGQAVLALVAVLISILLMQSRL